MLTIIHSVGFTCGPEYSKHIANALNYALSDEITCIGIADNALRTSWLYNQENESEKLIALNNLRDESND